MSIYSCYEHHCNVDLVSDRGERPSGAEVMLHMLSTREYGSLIWAPYHNSSETDLSTVFQYVNLDSLSCTLGPHL